MPELNGKPLTHQLWTDDSVLLACDRKSLQYMINKLKSCCDQWGLEVSIKSDQTSMTAIMIFNNAGRQLNESYTFNNGDIDIPSVKTYTIYLPWNHIYPVREPQKHPTSAQTEGTIRAYFGMKKYIDLRNVPKLAAFKLYDALMQPVVTYGFQIWLPGTEICKSIVGVKQPRSTMCNITSDPLERLHLSFLKWSIGVSKQTSNAAVYGDCGRKPTIIQITKQFVDFLNRLTLLDRNDSQSIVRQCMSNRIYLYSKRKK